MVVRRVQLARSAAEKELHCLVTSSRAAFSLWMQLSISCFTPRIPSAEARQLGVKSSLGTWSATRTAALIAIAGRIGIMTVVLGLSSVDMSSNAADPTWFPARDQG